MRISFRSRLFIAILLLGAAGTALRWTALLDYKLPDVQFAVLRSLQPQTPQRDVVIVGIEPRDGLIDFARGAAFDYIPLHQVLRWHAAQNTARLAGAFQGKAVLLGTVLGFEDRQHMPVALAAWESGEISSPGVLVHVTKFNARQRLEGEPPVDIGVGLHAGEAVVGHIGSSARHDFSAIGDATNVASRIENLTKDAGYRLLCSQVVAQRLPSTEMLTLLGPSAIKGHAAVEVWGYDRL